MDCLNDVMLLAAELAGDPMGETCHPSSELEEVLIGSDSLLHTRLPEHRDHHTC